MCVTLGLMVGRLSGVCLRARDLKGAAARGGLELTSGMANHDLTGRRDERTSGTVSTRRPVRSPRHDADSRGTPWTTAM
jgi:hypothetical protein